MATHTFNAVLLDYAIAPLVLATPGSHGVTITVTDTNGPGGDSDFLFDGNEQELILTVDGVDYTLTGEPMPVTGTATFEDSSGVQQPGSFFVVTSTDVADILRPLLAPGTELHEGNIPIFIAHDQTADFTLGFDGSLQSVVTPVAPYICFSEDTYIETEAGPVECRDLAVGDKVLTADGSFKPIQWIGTRTVDDIKLAGDPKLRPVRITAGALGSGLPRRDLVVTQQHRMLVSSVIADRVTGHRDVLVAANRLTELPGIFVDMANETITYVHLLFDQHEIIFAEGTPTESLFTGPEALKTVSLEAREEILTLFPELADHEVKANPACHIPGGKQQRKIVERHAKNRKPLLSAETGFPQVPA